LSRPAAILIVAIVALTAAVESQMGRPLTYRHGPVRLWSGNVQSDQNSQQIADPYTFTHFEHGALFYGLTWLVMRGASLGTRAVAAIAIEAAWEGYENTDAVIERYRTETISLGLLRRQRRQLARRHRGLPDRISAGVAVADSDQCRLDHCGRSDSRLLDSR
jgi:hypothetical protein